MFRVLLSSAALLAFAQPVLSQTVTGGVELEFVLDGDDSTQALIGYVEAESNGFYGGVWAQLANEEILNEVDLYLGYRGQAGLLSYDIYYTRYFFPDAGGDCCGDLTAELGYAINDQVTLGTELSYDPDSEAGAAYALAGISLTDQLGLDAKYGFYDVAGDRATEWELGVSYGLTDATAVALTYQDGEDYDPFVKLNLTWDFSIYPR